MLAQTVFIEAELTGKWDFTMEGNKSVLEVDLAIELEEVEFDNSLGNVYKPLDPRCPLRRTSLDT